MVITPVINAEELHDKLIILVDELSAELNKKHPCINTLKEIGERVKVLKQLISNTVPGTIKK